jgi:hypothetical protein
MDGSKIRENLTNSFQVTVIFPLNKDKVLSIATNTRVSHQWHKKGMVF